MVCFGVIVRFMLEIEMTDEWVWKDSESLGHELKRRQQPKKTNDNKNQRPKANDNNDNDQRRWPLPLLQLLDFSTRRHRSLGLSFITIIACSFTQRCVATKLTAQLQLILARSLVRLLPVAIAVVPAVHPHHPNVVHPYRRRRRLTPAFIVRLPSIRSSFPGHHRH